MNCSSPIIRIDAKKYPHFDVRPMNDGYFYPLDKYHELCAKIPREDVVLIPCGQCIGCRLKYAQQWAARMELESRSWKHAYYFTLTYSEEFIDSELYFDLYLEEDAYGTLKLEDMQKFFKMFRKLISPEKCKVFYCGEYGDSGNRPHYHSCVFTDYELNLVYKFTLNGHAYFNCNLVDEAWCHKGWVVISDFSYEDAAYVSRYCLKKVTQVRQKERDAAKMNIRYRKPPFAHMSTRPAIAKEYSEEHLNEIYYDDLIYTRKKKDVQALAPPRYFDKRLEALDPDLYECVKERRKINAIASRESSDDFVEAVKKRGIINESRIRNAKRKL